MPTGVPIYVKVNPLTGEVTNEFEGAIRADQIDIRVEKNVEESKVRWVEDPGTGLTVAQIATEYTDMGTETEIISGIPVLDNEAALMLSTLLGLRARHGNGLATIINDDWSSSFVMGHRLFQLPLEDTPGALPKTGNFTIQQTSTGNVWFVVTGTGEAAGGSPGFKTIGIAVDGSAVKTMGFYFNNTGVHHAFPVRIFKYPFVLNAGNHTVTLSAGAALNTDANDRFTVAVMEA